MKPESKLWILALTGPVIWFVSFCAIFALAPWACALHWKPALFVTSAVALLITAAAASVAWTSWRRVGRELPGESGGALPASRVLASGGVFLNFGFFLVILAQLIVTVILGACE